MVKQEPDNMDDRVWKAMMLFEHHVEKLAEEGITLVSFSVRLPTQEGSEYLIVGRFQTETEKLVTFRSGGTFSEVLVGFARSMQYKTLKYKVDDYG